MCTSPGLLLLLVDTALVVNQFYLKLSMYSLCSVMILQAASSAQCTSLVSQDCKGSRFIHDVDATRPQIDTRLGKVRCKLFKFKKNSKFHRSGAFLCNLPIKMFRDRFNETLQLLLTGKTFTNLLSSFEENQQVMPVSNDCKVS